MLYWNSVLELAIVGLIPNVLGSLGSSLRRRGWRLVVEMIDMGVFDGERGKLVWEDGRMGGCDVGTGCFAWLGFARCVVHRNHVCRRRCH